MKVRRLADKYLMPEMVGQHPSDDDLELYALGRLTEPDLGRVEEHLLVCEECRVRLDEEDAFVKAVRAALRRA